MDFSLILLNISCESYSVPKESMYTDVFLPINNETLCVHYYFLFKVNCLLKNPLNLGM